MDGARVLLVGPRTASAEATLRDRFPSGRVISATGPDELRQVVSGQLRFDAAVVDLVWTDEALEWDFDGLDALRLLREEGRSTATIVAAHGSGAERDLIDEALDPSAFAEVVGLVSTAAASSELALAVEAAASGRPVGGCQFPVPAAGPGPAIHTYFRGRRGHTAGHMAAAIASGRVASYRSLAHVAQVAPDTATKLLAYLGPLILARGEVPPAEGVTQGSAYRWCGEHARYLLGWSRRNDGPGQVVTRWRRRAY